MQGFIRACTFVVAMSGAAAAHAVDITGAGATFPYPIYSKWAEVYKAKTGVGLNYQSIGSGGGIKQIKAKTVDFGASDMPLKAEDLEKDGLVQFPAVIGGVVPVVNLEGIAPGHMKMTGSVLADIYMGKIKKWNDPAIMALNAGLKLPDENITVVRRADGSGTTFLFTNYLSKVNVEWKDKVGAGTAVQWPEGVGGKGNEGVAQYVQRIKGSIGYVEYAYAKKNKLDHIALKNKDNQFVQPEEASFAAASAGADWKSAPGMGVILTDQPGAKSWPMTSASFILVHAKAAKPEASREVLKFFDWAMKNGGKAAVELDYVPMPAATVSLIQGEWKKVTDASGKAVF